MIRPVNLTLWCLIAWSGVGAAADWPAFRGPTHNGISDGKAPTAWGLEDNIRWKVGLPNEGNGSPIVVEQHVLLAVAEGDEGKQRSLLCFDASRGDPLWVKTVEFAELQPTHATNPYCGTTPASDGQRVVVWHGSAGLHCYDLDGKKVWSRDLGQFRHMWGYGSSPIIHNGRVILHTGHGKRVFVTALEMATGKTLWETDEPLEGGIDRNDTGKYMGSWSTPVVAKVNGKDQIVVALPTRVNAYDPNSGDIVWSCDGMRHDSGDLAYSSPVIAGNICFVTGGFRGPAMGIRLGGSGNVTMTHRLWRTEDQPQSIGSGVFADGHVYRPNAGPGTIQCVDPANGRILWTERAGSHWSSIVMANGLLYATAQNATTIVFRPNAEKLEVVAKNSLDGTCHATPAIANGRIYIRTGQQLFCIGR